MDDLDIARIVAAKILLAKPADREEIMRTEIPPARFARVLALLPTVMAEYVDSFTAQNQRFRLSVEGVLRTFLRATQ